MNLSSVSSKLAQGKEMSVAFLWFTREDVLLRFAAFLTRTFFDALSDGKENATSFYPNYLDVALHRVYKSIL